MIYVHTHDQKNGHYDNVLIHSSTTISFDVGDNQQQENAVDQDQVHVRYCTILC